MEDDTLTIPMSSINAIEHYGDYNSSPVCVSDISLSTSTLQNSGTVTIDTDGLFDLDNRRKNLRDEGELPIDIWAKMYNNGVIDDE